MGMNGIVKVREGGGLKKEELKGDKGEQALRGDGMEEDCKVWG